MAVAGLLAGAANTAAGGGTLISYPALVAAGVPPIVANVSSAVGLLPGYIGGALAYRTELRPQADLARRLVPAAVLGGLTGAAVLLLTPSSSFELLVPYLVISGSLLFLAQPGLARIVAGRGRGVSKAEAVSPMAMVALVAGGAYGSYFSAGVGVLLLAILGLFLEKSIQDINALKNLLSLAAISAGSVVYIFTAEVNWTYVAILLTSSLVGGYVGGSFARRLRSDVLRYTIASLGIAVGLVLLLGG